MVNTLVCRIQISKYNGIPAAYHSGIPKQGIKKRFPVLFAVFSF